MCDYCGLEFTDGDEMVVVAGSTVHVRCLRHAEALEATAGDEIA